MRICKMANHIASNLLQSGTSGTIIGSCFQGRYQVPFPVVTTPLSNAHKGACHDAATERRVFPARSKGIRPSKSHAIMQHNHTHELRHRSAQEALPRPRQRQHGLEVALAKSLEGCGQFEASRGSSPISKILEPSALMVLEEDGFHFKCLQSQTTATGGVQKDR